MVQQSSREEAATAAPTALPAWRPVLFFLCVGLTMAGLIWLATLALSPGGLSALDIVLVALFALTLPWYVIGFWNATIGLLIMRFARDPVAAVLPVAGHVAGRRTDHRLDRDPPVHPQRAARSRREHARGDDAGPRRAAAWANASMSTS